MATPYIPTRDSVLLLWAQNFSSLITANPTMYGLGTGDATTIAGYTSAYSAALTTAVDPSTKTKASVAAKDSAKATMLVTLRPYAQQIKNNLGVTNDAKVALGLNIPDPSRSPVPAPTTQPLLSIVGALPLQISLRFSDASTPDKRAKPKGVVGLQLFVYVGATVPTDPLAYQFAGIFTKQPFAVNFTGAQKGQLASLIGRWQTRTGLNGPWSSPVQMTIAG